MRRLSMPHAYAVACLLLLLTPVTAAAATPAPSPAPSPKCTIPPGMQADPQEQQLQQQCLAQVRQVQDQKNKLTNNLALAQGSAESLKGMLQQTRQAITDNLKSQDQTRQQIHDLEVQEAETQRQIDATRERLAQKRSAYADFIRRSYIHQPSVLAYLFDARGLGDFLSRMAALAQIRQYGRDLIHGIREEEARLNRQEALLKADHQTALQKQADLVKAQHDLIDAEVQEAQILVALDGSIQDAQNELNSADGQSAALVAQIVAAQIAREDALIQQADDAAWAAAQAWLASNKAVNPANPNHSQRYPMIWAAQTGVITQGFGPTDYAAEPPGFGAPHFHAGIDVANNTGTPIFAADDGVVVAAETSMLGDQVIGYGRHVIVATFDAGGQLKYLTLYGHLDGYIVKVGQQVTQSQEIGVMGSTGNSSGPHVHFEVRVNNTPVDPTPYLPPNGPNSTGFQGHG